MDYMPDKFPGRIKSIYPIAYELQLLTCRGGDHTDHCVNSGGVKGVRPSEKDCVILALRKKIKVDEGNR